MEKIERRNFLGMGAAAAAAAVVAKPAEAATRIAGRVAIEGGELLLDLDRELPINREASIRTSLEVLHAMPTHANVDAAMGQINRYLEDGWRSALGEAGVVDLGIVKTPGEFLAIARTPARLMTPRFNWDVAARAGLPASLPTPVLTSTGIIPWAMRLRTDGAQFPMATAVARLVTLLPPLMAAEVAACSLGACDIPRVCLQARGPELELFCYVHVA